MNTELEKLIDLALSDGVLSSKEREIIFRKAETLGVDKDELEIYLENKISILSKNSTKPVHEDGFDISTTELLLRTKKWVSTASENFYSGRIEKFPKQIAENKKFFTAGLDIGKNVFKAVRSNFKSKLSFTNPMNYIRLANQIIDAGEGERKIEHQEIVGLANAYLTILEIRATKEDSLKIKFDELFSLLNANLKIYEERKNSKWFKKLF